MAKYEVTGPDGVAVVVEAPDGATERDLVRIAMDKAAARPAPATASEKMLASGAGRLLKGMKDPIDAGAQLLPRALSGVASVGGLLPNKVSEWLDSEAAKVDSGIKNGEQDYQNARFKDGQSGFDGFRFAGNVVNPATVAIARITPSGAATTLGRAFQGATAGAVGAVAGTPISDTSEASFAAQKVGQGLAGALGGGVFSPLAGKVADIGAPLVKRIQASMTPPDVLGARASLATDTAVTKVLRDAGIDGANVPDNVMADLRRQVLASFKKGQKLDAAAALRKMDFDAQGVPALRGQITRDPAQYSRDLNLRGIEGVGEPVQNVLSAQNQAITSGLAKFGGPKAGDKFSAGDSMTGALGKLDERLSGEVRRAYQNARSSSGKDWDVPMTALSHEVQGVIDDFGVGAEKNAVPSAIYSRLKSFGVVGDDMTQRKVFNYEEADKLLKQINAHDDGMNGSIGKLRAAVKNALLEGGGDGDPFGPARKLAADRFALLDAVPALDAVVKGKIAPDDFVQRFIVGGKVKDLKKLAEVLPDESLSEAKKQIARVIYEGAFKGNVSGDKMASPAGLQNAMKTIGAEKLKVFFSPAEIDELNRLTRLTAYANTEPAWGTVARGGNPGGVLFGGIAKIAGAGGKLAGAMPVIGAGQNVLRASAALNTSVPKTANLSPEEVAKLSGLLNIGSIVSGGLLAPRP